MGEESYQFSRWLFLRLVGCVLLAAFASLWVQIAGLIGSEGILPAQELLVILRNMHQADAFWVAPTVFWWGASNTALHAVCLAGMLGAILLMADVVPVLMLLLCWIGYVSLAVVGQDFLNFQWDSLLLETTFFAVLVAPWQFWGRPATQRPPGLVGIWLLRALLTRFVFLSGIAKLLSGDPTWRALSALSVHYETQPLPHLLSWYAHQAPLLVHQLSVVLTFGIELICPWLLWCGRRLRHLGALAILVLQLAIMATGNYGFFNLLTIALCLLQLDDRAWPARWQRWLGMTADEIAVAAPEDLEQQALLHGVQGRRQKRRRVVFAVLLLFTLVTYQFARLQPQLHWPAWAINAQRCVQQLRLVNHYGLFAVMTTQRPELMIEGSHDGQSWQRYAFRYKPDHLDERPRLTGLHMPRLDWQLWFAALGRFEDETWFQHFCQRLLEGEPAVLRLLEHSPFVQVPPRYLRVLIADYHFTTPAERRQTGHWWRQGRVGAYSEVLSLR